MITFVSRVINILCIRIKISTRHLYVRVGIVVAHDRITLLIGEVQSHNLKRLNKFVELKNENTNENNGIVKLF